MPYTKKYGYTKERLTGPITTRVERGTTDLAIKLYSDRDYERALAFVENDINYDPSKSESTGKAGYSDMTLSLAYLVAGLCNRRLGRLDEAIRYFNLACEIARKQGDNDQMASIRIGQCYAQQNDHAKAMEYYNYAAQSPTNISYETLEWCPLFNTDRVYLYRAISRQALGDIAGAKDDCEKALSSRKGNYPKAAALLERLVSGTATRASTPFSTRGGQVTEAEYGPGGRYSARTVDIPTGPVIDYSRPAAGGAGDTSSDSRVVTTRPSIDPATMAKAQSSVQNSLKDALRDLPVSGPREFNDAELTAYATQELLHDRTIDTTNLFKPTSLEALETTTDESISTIQYAENIVMKNFYNVVTGLISPTRQIASNVRQIFNVHNQMSRQIDRVTDATNDFT